MTRISGIISPHHSNQDSLLSTMGSSRHATITANSCTILMCGMERML